MNNNLFPTASLQDASTPSDAHAHTCRMDSDNFPNEDGFVINDKKAIRQLGKVLREVGDHLGRYDYCPLSRLNDAPHISEIPGLGLTIYGPRPEIPIVSIGGVEYIHKGLTLHLLCKTLVEKQWHKEQEEEQI